MIEYIKNIIPRIKSYSERVDKEELLLDKTWVWVDFNKGYSTFHFLRDKRLLISNLGDVQEGSWEFIGKDLLHLKGEGFNVLLNHGIIFKGVLIIQKKGVLDSYEILYDEAVVPDGDIIKYIDNKLLKISQPIQPSKPEIPTNFTTYLCGREINVPNPPKTGQKIQYPELLSGKIVDIPDSLGVEIENNVIRKVFKAAQLHTSKGIIQVEVENLDWNNPVGQGYFRDSNHNLPNGDFSIYYSEPSFLDWKKIVFQNGKITRVGYLSESGMIVLTLFALTALTIIIFVLSQLN
ncbi:MAG: hypothetical protein ACK45H_03310 [Bacteroidota bacterium]